MSRSLSECPSLEDSQRRLSGIREIAFDDRNEGRKPPFVILRTSGCYGRLQLYLDQSGIAGLCMFDYFAGAVAIDLSHIGTMCLTSTARFALGLRPLLPLPPIQHHRFPNERGEGGFVEFLAFVDVDGAAGVAFEARVEQA